MMHALLRKAVSNNIIVLANAQVTDFHEGSNGVAISLGNFEFSTGKLLLATNGFSAGVVPEVKPARAQVLITELVSDLPFKGTFHLDRGYYYFRDVDGRVLLGGGRNLDPDGETTTDFGLTEIIQDKLDQLLKGVILPGRDVAIAHRWSGIMGLGIQKNPIVKQMGEHTYCGVRLGGMGVAIGSLVGSELADLIEQ
jgi:glycine/D-amino acid oxidase-like deaminating enzyme